MLTLYKGDGTAAIIKCDDYHVRELPTGLDELEFEISIWNELYPDIVEESRIKEQSNATVANYYIVKAIDAGTETATIKCQVDVRELCADMVLNAGFSPGPNGTPFSDAVWMVLNEVTGPAWSTVDAMGTDDYKCYVDKILFGAATPLEYLFTLMEYYPKNGIRINAINRSITMISKPSSVTDFPYITREVNLKEINYKGKSTEFATRLYPYGENKLSISSVNGGVPYIDNHQYSNEIVSAYWQDDNYTSAASLLADAQTKLAEMSTPDRCYEVDVVDLAAANPQTYPFLTFSLLQPAVLIDEARGLRALLSVVERYIYPNYPQNNKIVFSSSAQRIQTQVARLRRRKL